MTWFAGNLLSCCLWANDAAPRYQVLATDISDHLTQKSIFSIFRASTGFVWLSTFSGAARYDGHDLVEFDSWQDANGNTRPLNITSLVESPDGDILAATQNSGLLVYDNVARRFIPHRRYTPPALDGSSNTISNLLPDSSGAIWFGYADGTIARLGANSLRAELIETGINGQVTDIIEDANGRVLVSSSDGSIVTFGESAEIRTSTSINTLCNLGAISLEEIQILEGGGILAGTRGAGLYSVDLKGRHCKKIALEEEKPDYSIVHEIHRVDLFDEYRIATDQGLYVIRDNRLVSHFHKENSGLPHSEVISLFSADQGISWIGTYNGIGMLVPSLFDLYGARDNPRLRGIAAISSSRPLGTWIATYDGLYRYDPAADQHIAFGEYFPDAKIAVSKVMSLLVEDDTIWIGTRHRGVIQFNTESGQYRHFNTHSAPPLSADGISALLRLDTGALLVGTYGGGLNIIHPDGNVSQHSIQHTGPSTGRNNVILLYQDRSGRIWVGTENGLHIFDPVSTTFTTVEISQPSGASTVTVSSIVEDRTGNLWFGTLHHGLFTASETSVRREASALEPYQHNGLLNQTIYAMQTSKEGDIWLATNAGLTRIQELNKVRHFRRNHGLQSMEFEFGASHKDASGRLYFGGLNGYNRFDPSTLSTDTGPSPVVLTDIEISGGFPELSRPVRDVERIELGHGDYYVTFEFASQDYLDPSSNLYRHKLEGFDPEWIETGNHNTATYTNLPAGNYTLRVQGANSAGIWNRDGIATRVTVRPAPWLSWWACGLYLLGALLIAWRGKRNYDNHIIKRQAFQLARDMREAADQAMDDVQEQLDHQTKLVDTIHHFNLQKLKLVEDCFRRHCEYLPPTLGEGLSAGYGRRLMALRCLERSLYYQYDELLANLHQFTDLLTAELQRSAPPGHRISVINSATETLMPAKLALPASVLLYELLSNTIEHGVKDNALPCFARVEVHWRPKKVDQPATLLIAVEDNGPGLPPNICFESPESEGIATIADITRHLDADLSLSVRGGTRIEIAIPAHSRHGATQAAEPVEQAGFPDGLPA